MLHRVSRDSSWKGADGGAGELQGVTRSGARPQVSDEVQDEILCRDAAAEPAVDGDPHLAGLSHGDGLGGEHVLDLGGADAEGQRPEAAHRAGVAVAADQGGPGQRNAELRGDHVDDPLARVVEIEEPDPGRSSHSPAACRTYGPAGAKVSSRRPGACGDDVVDGGEGELGIAHPPPGAPEPLEGPERRDLVDHVAVHVEQIPAVVEPCHHVAGPELVEEGASH